MIWLWMIVLTLLAMAAVALPMRRAPARMAPISATDPSPEVLQDQLDEVSRDLERGVISEDEAAAARQEIKRRILTIARRGGRALHEGQGRWVLWFAAALTPLIAAGYYAFYGAPQVASLAYADRAAERAEVARVAGLADKLRDGLMAAPDGGATQGWALLGQTYMRMGRYADAVDVFERLTKREDATSSTFSILAEARIQLENGIVTPPAEAAADRAMALDPGNPAGVFYKAQALSQKGQEGAAHDMLKARLDRAEQVAPWMEPFMKEANRLGRIIGRPPVTLARFELNMTDGAAPGPNAEDVAAAAEMSQGDRAEFIRSMVTRLAERLENNPDDLDGWMRLGNARRVLGENEAARAAYDSAARLLASQSVDDPRRAVVKQALEALQQEE